MSEIKLSWRYDQKYNDDDQKYNYGDEYPILSDAGAIIFENETILEFSRQFLSISISTNKAVYDGGQDIR